MVDIENDHDEARYSAAQEVKAMLEPCSAELSTSIRREVDARYSRVSERITERSNSPEGG